MGVKKKGHDPVEVILQPTADADTPDVNYADALRALMEFYESGEGGGEEENEVDLMIQLSGMTYNGTQSDD
ncbi:MAG: hypothetical protein M3Q16_02505 [Pseudomonadota bacterium]|nr:hypothetical protein [Pseudomonadota bacterium]